MTRKWIDCRDFPDDTAARPPQPTRRAHEGSRGTTLTPARLAHTPGTSSSDKPLPDPGTAYGPALFASHPRRRCRPQRNPERPLTQRLRYGK
jgi:hypothetical protein